LEDYSNKTRNECVDLLRNRRLDVRSAVRAAKISNVQRNRQNHLRAALECQQEVVAIRERQMQLDREERDALSIELQLATLEAEEKRAKS
jgi:hypothetical protein